MAAAALPVAAIVLTTGSPGWVERVETAAVYSFVWSLAVGMGCSLSGSFLTALGPRVAVARGVLLALVISSAAGRWLPGLRMSFEATVLVGVVVFVLSAWWETFSLRHVMPAARLLIVGTGSGAVNLVHDVQQGRGGGYMVVGVVSEEALPGLYHGVPVLGRTDDLQDVISEHTPDIVVLAPGPNRPQTFLQLLEAAEVGFRVVELAQFYEHAYGRVPVEDLTRAWFMSVLHLYQRPYSRVLKRTVDLVGACLVFLFTLPLFPLLALLVRRSEGPVLIRQLRLGEHGRLFTIYKFRTMYADAETPGRAVWAHVEDPRVTRLGGIMRRLRLDELPQLWNVIRGDMSLVGPRPERPEFLDELAARVPYWTRRHLVKPGLTGWAQVRQGYTASAEATSEKLSYDLWYIRHRSLVVDLAILLRTFAVVLQGDRKHHAPSSREREARVETLAPADS